MNNIIPYSGYGEYLFDKDIETIKTILKNAAITYSTAHRPNKGCSPEVAWDIIRIGNEISMFFAKGKMFKIYFENGFSGALQNGIRLGQSINEAKIIDPSIEYDDWNEEYISKLGYWLEDDIETEQIVSITVFIKALENEEYYYSYKWCES